MLWTVAVSLVLVAASYVLYETLPPLGDTTDPTDPKAPDYHFSRSYLAARQKFLTRATAAGATLASEVIYHDAEIGVNLTMDAAFFKGSRPEKLLVHISGTHGVEGFAGSAIQAKLLEGFRQGKTGGASVLFVHAVNPYGFHFGRRFNENNVDLNRNWMWSAEEWQKALSREPNAHGYEDARSILNPAVSSWWDYFLRVPALIPGLFKQKAIKLAIIAGQYHDPRGIYYGGTQRESGTIALNKFFQQFGAGVKEVIALDVHSGLGPCGEDSLMVDDAEEAQAARKVIHESAGRLEYPDTDPNGPVGGYNLVLGAGKVQKSFPTAQGAHITQEFGTRPGLFVAMALAFENAAFHQTHWNSVAHQFGTKLLRAAFFVETTEWKDRVLERGVDLFGEIKRNF